jgi:dihydroorotate dehydrogenase
MDGADDSLSRGMQTRKVLQDLLTGVTNARDELVVSNSVQRKPRIVLKIAPDLDESQIIDIADVVKDSHIDGVIVSNTTIQRPTTLQDRELAACLSIESETDALPGAQQIEMRPEVFLALL